MVWIGIPRSARGMDYAGPGWGLGFSRGLVCPGKYSIFVIPSCEILSAVRKRSSFVTLARLLEPEGPIFEI